MLLDGPYKAVNHTRIRSQLKRVVISLGQSRSSTSWIQSRNLATQQSHGPTDQTDASIEDDHTVTSDPFRPLVGSTDSQSAVDSHNDPFRKITIRSGRRQRASAQRLATNSLGRSSNVIILRDVRKSQEKVAHKVIKPLDTSNHNLEDTGEQDLETKPPSTDVYESIEELRPAESFLDEDDFTALTHRLAQGYTLQQLKSYLRRTLSASGSPNEAEQGKSVAVSSIWQAGRSPLEERLPVAAKEIIQSKKDDVIGQILRTAWSISVHSQEQEIGEQEFTLPSDTSRQLCGDLGSGSQRVPAWQTLLSSPLLARSVQLLPSPGSGVIRVVGRRLDTSQVINELCEKLTAMPSLVLTGTMLQTLSGRNAQEISAILGPSVLEQIQQSSSTSVTLTDDGDLSLSGFQAWHCHHARTIIYDVLGIENATTQTTLADTRSMKKVSTTTVQPKAMPVFINRVDALHSQEYSRLALPLSKKQSDDASTKPRSDKALLKLLRQQAILDMDPATDEEHTARPAPTKKYADGFGSAVSNWNARIGLVLQPAESTTELRRFVPQSPFSDALLDLFAVQTRRNTGRRNHKRSLIAHLVPLSITARTRLPDLELRFEMENSPSGHERRFHFYSLTMKLSQHRIQIPMPERCADVELCNEVSLTTRYLKALLTGGKTWNTFNSFRTAIENQAHDMPLAQIQGLVPSNPLHIKLPTRFLQPEQSESSSEDTTMDSQYAVSHFQLRDEARYIPASARSIRDKAVAERLGDWPNTTYLKIIDSDLGVFGGRRRELSILKSNRPTTLALGEGSKSAPTVQSEAAKDVLRSASVLIDIMTSALRA